MPVTRLVRTKERPAPESPVIVPGLGPVDWSTEQLQAYADRVGRHHQPGSVAGWTPGQHWLRRLANRLVGASRPRMCRHCGRPWICPQGAWSQRWRSETGSVGMRWPWSGTGTDW